MKRPELEFDEWPPSATHTLAGRRAQCLLPCPVHPTARIAARARCVRCRYRHWSFPDDDPALSEPSYMMARRLKPMAERSAEAPPSEDSILERSRELMAEERPAVVAGGARATFIKALEDEKAAEEARQKAWADSAWIVVPEDAPFKKEVTRRAE